MCGSTSSIYTEFSVYPRDKIVNNNYKTPQSRPYDATP